MKQTNFTNHEKKLFYTLYIYLHATALNTYEPKKDIISTAAGKA
jgi:hypothetical protein